MHSFARLLAVAAVVAALPLAAAPAPGAVQEPPAPAAATVATVDELAFLAGCWEGDLGGGTAIHESYTAPAGGAILGNSRVIRDGGTLFFEFSRIADDGAGVAFRPYPNGEATVSFALVRSSPFEAVFENPDHDHPQRIVYRRLGDRLTAEVGNLDGSRTERFPMRSVSCGG